MVVVVGVGSPEGEVELLGGALGGGEDGVVVAGSDVVAVVGVVEVEAGLLLGDKLVPPVVSGIGLAAAGAEGWVWADELRTVGSVWVALRAGAGFLAVVSAAPSFFLGLLVVAAVLAVCAVCNALGSGGAAALRATA